MRLIWRWFTGLELDGIKRTNARWNTKGDDTRHGIREDDVLNWHYLPRSRRALVRTGGTALVLLVLVSFWIEPAQTWFVIKCLGVLGLAVFVFWACTRLASAETLQRDYEPLALVLSDRWNFTPPADPTSWITVPEDTRTNADHPTEVILPPNYREPPRAQQQSAKLIADRTGMKTHDFEIDYDAGPRPVMKVRAMEVPPEIVPFSTVRHILDRSGDGRYFLGLGLRTVEVWADLNGDGPHWVWSCGTGAGKTTAGRNVAAQVRREGGKIVIFDPVKAGDSHADWIYDEHGHLLDGIEHYTTIEETHEALVRYGEERQRRAHLATEAKRFRRPAPRFQRILFLFEEQNGAYDMLTDYWKYLRKVLKAAEGEDQPETSPAMTATKVLIYAGRSALMSCFVSCQRFDAKIVGGGDVRGNFMVRMLARFDESARRMLIPDILPKPVSSNHLGRSIACMDGVAIPFQGVLMEPDEARDWSSEGRPMILERLTDSDVRAEEIIAVRTADQPEHVSELGPRTPLQLVPKPPERRQVTIKAALEEGLVSGTESAVARALHRAGMDKAGREGKADTYYADELAVWEEGRARRAVVTR
jgi:hypothetical protein